MSQYIKEPSKMDKQLVESKKTQSDGSIGSEKTENLENFESANTYNGDNEFAEKKMPIPFWLNDPNILLHPTFFYEFFPNASMSYTQKLNAITRLVILTTILGFIFTRKLRIVFIGCFTVLAIAILHHTQNKKKLMLEGFAQQKQYGDPVQDVLEDYSKEYSIDVPTDIFDEPTPENPFSNILIPDYEYNVDKKPAPPAFGENTEKKIMKEAKQMIVNLNATQPAIADKLFKSLGDEFEFEQSMRPFHSQPATTIPNNQELFSQFCFGSMISSKEGNPFSLVRQKSNYNLY